MRSGVRGGAPGTRRRTGLTSRSGEHSGPSTGTSGGGADAFPGLARAGLSQRLRATNSSPSGD
ncbi:predicted protein [Streptomyces filamentosus NRRL 15998]|uniref:Predicted protein n=1 Tax=Streptomyces filamentosus NRRL 15998 TaxID=457431 RepID=D6AN73_STRFL|nr:predicted protein [Streptomyces filamentosus NRRL 15998]